VRGSGGNPRSGWCWLPRATSEGVQGGPPLTAKASVPPARDNTARLATPLWGEGGATGDGGSGGPPPLPHDWPRVGCRCPDARLGPVGSGTADGACGRCTSVAAVERNLDQGTASMEARASARAVPECCLPPGGGMGGGQAEVAILQKCVMRHRCIQLCRIMITSVLSR